MVEYFQKLSLFFIVSQVLMCMRRTDFEVDVSLGIGEGKTDDV